MEFSPHIIFGQDEQMQWPRVSQHIDERFLEWDNDVCNRDVWCSLKWLSDEQLDELMCVLLQTTFEQSINSFTEMKNKSHPVKLLFKNTNQEEKYRYCFLWSILNN